MNMLLSEHGMVTGPDHIYRSLGECDMYLQDNSPIIRLRHTTVETFVKPVAELLFRPAASIFEKFYFGMVLTALGYDRTQGATEISTVNSLIPAQDLNSSVMNFMAQSAIDCGILYLNRFFRRYWPNYPKRSKKPFFLNFSDSPHKR